MNMLNKIRKLKGDSNSYFQIGLDYFNGNGEQQSYEESITWFQHAADLQHPDAYYYLGLCHENGLGVLRNPKESLSFYKKAKELGNVNATKYLQAIEYDNAGFYTMAIPLFQELYPTHIDAAHFLGYYYLEGYVFKRDYYKAVEYLSLAAKANHEFALNNLAVCYWYGDGVEKDPEFAIKLAKKAYELGNISASTNIDHWESDLFIQKGNAIYDQAEEYFSQKQYAQAFELYKQANELYQNRLAIRKLGLCYEYGYGITVNKISAIQYYQKAISVQDNKAPENLKQLIASLEAQESYELAIVFERNKKYELAFQLLIQAAKNNYIPSYFKIGYFYDEGLGIKTDYTKAAQWYHKGCDNKCSLSANNLGLLYESGNGVSHDKKKALELFKFAYENGSENGKRNYNRLSAELLKNSPITRLNELIGLTNVKKEVATLINMANYQKMRQEQNLSTINVSMHMVFDGNPGTGKTTVARRIGEIYHELGLLPSEKFIEVSRNNLVAEHIGGTAIMTQNIIDQAMGGVLFIDEAYTLTKPGDTQDFGQEAIDTLLKNMEDHRDNLVVIVAGYTDEMHKFINSNPGLESRFRKHIHFDDYNSDELEQLFYKYVTDNQFRLSEDAKVEVKHICTEMYDNRDKHFGNARNIRNFYETVYEKVACRIGSSYDVQHLDLITLEDILAAKYDIFEIANVQNNTSLGNQEIINYTSVSVGNKTEQFPINMLKFKIIKTGEVLSAYSFRKEGTKIYIKFSENGKEYGYSKDNIEFLNS